MTPTPFSFDRPVLVAHRGYALRYPENSLEALQAAFAAGAQWVEFDVQSSADGVPFLLHDADLQRTAGIRDCALDWDWQRLSAVEINEAERLGNAFHGVRLPALQDVVQLLARYSDKQAFVEIKRASLQRFGVEVVTDRVLEVLKPVLSRCVLISFDRDAIQTARDHGGARIGWVIGSWTAEARSAAGDLVPEYLFCNHERLPETGALWPGPWRWVLYDVQSAELALTLARRGARFIETGAIGELLQDPRLLEGADIG